MCSNFQSLTPQHADWVRSQFQCELPESPWRDEIYPNYAAPFISVVEGKPRCELAQFGLVPSWATDKKKFGLKTYNARSETVAEKPSYRVAWKHRQFGLALMQSFYEPNYATGKAIRWRIRPTDAVPLAVATIWERFVDLETGEMLFSFSMLTVNAEGHPVMQQFHKPGEEKRSIVVLSAADYQAWLHSTPDQARSFLKPPADSLLTCEAAPR